VNRITSNKLLFNFQSMLRVLHISSALWHGPFAVILVLYCMSW